MSVYVFLGPTLPVEQARAELDATFVPPVAQGDVYRIGARLPRVLGIIDGYFERMPAVWHKEILWALSKGIAVFGAASMGALRAAELAPFGMVGIGQIYQSYVDGVLEDDDEVAVTHVPEAGLGYEPQSEAMVNIRATVEAAVPLIGSAVGDQLVRIAKDLHYPLRTYSEILARAEQHGLDGVALRRFEEWLPDGRVDRKREDALKMLRAIRDHLRIHPERTEPCFELELTLHAERAMREALDDANLLSEPSPGTGVLGYLKRILDRSGSDPVE